MVNKALRKKKKKKKKSAAMKLRNLGHCCLRFIKATSKLLCYVHVTNNYLFAPAIATGSSMLPTIDWTGNWFIMERISTRFGKIDRGDVVALLHPRNPNTGIVKRVIGLEGDRLRHCSNTDTYALVRDDFAQISYHQNNDMPETIVVPKGAVWVEGDNKDQSKDSRDFGPIPYDLIKARLFWRILPFKQFGPFWDK